jgi:hypothetical protein
MVSDRFLFRRQVELDAKWKPTESVPLSFFVHFRRRVE